MSEPFIGQIMMFGGNFAIRGFAQCDGQLLPIAQNTALFSILGTTYGGDGRTTFALPDLRSRAPIHRGPGPGLTNHSLGSRGGQESVSLTAQNLPAHNHTVNYPCNAGGADSDDPDGNFPAVSGTDIYASTSDANMATADTSNAGSGSAVNVRNPYLAINFLIALQGIFPPRN